MKSVNEYSDSEGFSKTSQIYLHQIHYQVLQFQDIRHRTPRQGIERII